MDFGYGSGSFLQLCSELGNECYGYDIADTELSYGKKINDIFDTFATARAEVGASSRRAQENETAAQDILLTIEEDVSDIRDADLASLLTQLEFLLTNKEAAQATFTRITSKSLFDFLG